MRKLIAIISVLLSHSVTHGQVVYLEPTEKGHEKIIAFKLMQNQIAVVSTEDSADILIRTETISHVVAGTGRAKVIIFKAGSREKLAETKSIRSTFNAFQGYKTPATLSVRKISDKYLLPMLEKLDKKLFTKTVSKSNGALSVVDQIKQLKELLDSGAITQEEYDTMKKKVIN